MSKITGKDAYIYIAKSGDSQKDACDTWAVSDFTVNLDRGTIEQELVGEIGNYFTAGSLSIDGSLTNCRFAASGNYELIESIVESNLIEISGGIHTTESATNLKWFFHSAQITGFDITFGDANTITEASIDYAIMNPYQVYWDDTNGIITD